MRSTRAKDPPSAALGSIFFGTAGWTIPKAHGAQFPTKGSHLARYASCFSAVEINSSFYKPHRPGTYARWAESVPPDFRFAVKVPKSITHEARLIGVEEQLVKFLDEVRSLGDKLGPLLAQLPPSFEFSDAVAAAFFAAFRQQFDGSIVCEPRHSTWFTAEAEDLLRSFRIARVAADPAVVPAAAEPGGWPGVVYYRLHGSPDVYYSSYSDEFLRLQTRRLNGSKTSGAQAWCIFDNTARGAATGNALAIIELLQSIA